MNKIGIIGCGRQAPKHINGYLGNGIKDIYLSDVDLDKAIKKSFDKVTKRDKDRYSPKKK